MFLFNSLHFQVKALIQSKEELEKCIKEQELNKDVSVPKTDDLVDEVPFLKPKFTFTVFESRLQPSKMKMVHYAPKLRCWRKKV